MATLTASPAPTRPAPQPKLNLTTLPHDILLVLLRSVNSFSDLRALLLTSRVFSLLFKTHGTVILPSLANKFFCKEAFKLLDFFRPNEKAVNEISRGFFLDIAQGTFGQDGRPELSPVQGKIGKEECEWLLRDYEFVKGWAEVIIETKRNKDKEKIGVLQGVGKIARATQLGVYSPPAKEEVRRIERAVYNLAILAFQFHCFGVRNDVDGEETVVEEIETEGGGNGQTESAGAGQQNGDGDTDMADAAVPAATTTTTTAATVTTTATTTPAANPQDPVAEAIAEASANASDADAYYLKSIQSHPKPFALSFDPPQPHHDRRSHPMFYDYTYAMTLPIEHFAECLSAAQQLKILWALPKTLYEGATDAIGAGALRHFLLERSLDPEKAQDINHRRVVFDTIESGIQNALWNRGRAHIKRLKETVHFSPPKSEFETKIIQTLNGLGVKIKKKMLILTEDGMEDLGLAGDEVFDDLDEDDDDDDDDDDDLDDMDEDDMDMDDDDMDDDFDDDEFDEDEYDEFAEHAYFYHGGGGGMYSDFDEEEDDWDEEDEEEYGSASSYGPLV